MKLSITTTVALLLSTTVDCRAVSRRDDTTDLDGNAEVPALDVPVIQDLEKRRGGGGGGGGGRGGSSGGSSGGRSGSGGSSSSGSRGGSSSSSSRGSSSRGSSSGRPRTGNYIGGARTPYVAGQPVNGIRPYVAPAAALAFFPGLLLVGAYMYHYPNYNYTDRETRKNETIPVSCFCQEYNDCSCDDKSTAYQKGFNNGQPTNGSDVQVATVNGTRSIVVNGTVPNVTSESSDASSLNPGQSMVLNSGYWAMVAVVIGAVWM